METPNGSPTESEIHIDLPNEYFFVKAIRDTVITEYMLKIDSCEIKLNGRSNLSEVILKEHNLSCERATLYKNYYTYLYGLPMKLRDKGTILATNVSEREFKAKTYQVLKVNYTEGVGKDSWYF